MTHCTAPAVHPRPPPPGIRCGAPAVFPHVPRNTYTSYNWPSPSVEPTFALEATSFHRIRVCFLPPSFPPHRVCLARTANPLDSAGAGIAFIRRRQVVRRTGAMRKFWLQHARTTTGQRSEGFIPTCRPSGTDWPPTPSWQWAALSARSAACADGMVRYSGADSPSSPINPQDSHEGSIWLIDDIDEQKTAQNPTRRGPRGKKEVLFDSAMVGIVYLQNRF